MKEAICPSMPWGGMSKEDLDLWEAYDMSLPSVVTKLMWILGQTEDPKEARKLFQTPINRDTLWF